MEDKEKLPEGADSSINDCNTFQNEEEPTEKVEDNSETISDDPKSTESIDVCTIDPNEESNQIVNRTDHVEPMICHDESKVETDSKTPSEAIYVSEAGPSRSSRNQSISQHEMRSDHGEASGLLTKGQIFQRTVIDPRQMGPHRSAPSFDDGERCPLSDKGEKSSSSNELDASVPGLPTNFKESAFSSRKKFLKNKSKSLEVIRRQVSSLTITDFRPKTSLPVGMDSISNLLSRNLSLNDSIRGASGSNENNDVPQWEFCNENQEQIESTNNENSQEEIDFPDLDFLKSTIDFENSKKAGKRTMKDSSSGTLQLPPSHSSNQNRDWAQMRVGTRNSSVRVKPNFSYLKDDSDDNLESSDSDKSDDRQRTRKTSSAKNKVEPSKSKNSEANIRKRRSGRSTINYPPQLDMPSCSYVRAEPESTESDTSYDREWMQTLEKTGYVPDVKDLKRKVKKEKSVETLKSRKQLRPHSVIRTRRSISRSRDLPGCSHEPDQPRGVSPLKPGASNDHSSSDEQESKISAFKSHRMRRKRVALRSSDSNLLKSNSELIMVAETESSPEAGSSKRLRKYSTVENLKRKVDESTKEILNSPEEFRSRKQRKRDASFDESSDEEKNSDLIGKKRMRRSRSSEK